MTEPGRFGSNNVIYTFEETEVRHNGIRNSPLQSTRIIRTSLVRADDETRQKAIGISDVGLRKVCAKLKVPVPERGYWAKVQTGWRGNRPKLPGTNGPEELVVERWKRTSIDSMSSEVQSKIAQEKSKTNHVVVVETMASIHPLVVRTLDSLKNARLEDDDLLKPVDLGCLDVRVSRSSLDRAIRIIDALIKVLEIRGFTVSVSNGLEPNSSVEILGEPIQFALTESMEHVEQELTAAEKKEKLKSPWLYSTPRYEALPSVRLELIIKDNAGQGLRKRWADRENKRLEDQLNAFLAGLIRIASEAKSERIELERRTEGTRSRRATKG